MEKVQSDSPSGTPTIASGPGQTGTSLEPVTGYESSLGVTGGSSQNPALIGSSPPNPIAATGTVQSNTMLASATASGAATDNTSASTPHMSYGGALAASSPAYGASSLGAYSAYPYGSLVSLFILKTLKKCRKLKF